MSGGPAPLSAKQVQARDRWQDIWNVPILVAALVPLFVTSPKTRWVQLVVGLGSWLVFVIDLGALLRIDHSYLRRRNGKVDAVIVVLTCPYYLIPGISGSAAILLLARLARVVRVLLATKGLRRFAKRLGKVTVVAAVVVVVASLAAYQAEHKTNSEFATIGDALWWGVVTLTTVGYGDIVPETTAGRLAGVAIMFTGIAVLGILAGSLASLFNLEPTSEEEPAKKPVSDEEPAGAPGGAGPPGAPGAAGPACAPGAAGPAGPPGGTGPPPLPVELAMLQAQLKDVEMRLGRLAERIGGGGAAPGASGAAESD